MKTVEVKSEPTEGMAAAYKQYEDVVKQLVYYSEKHGFFTLINNKWYPIASGDNSLEDLVLVDIDKPSYKIVRDLYTKSEASNKKLTYKDLNEYIQTFMGKDFSIKDFRTYAANYHFINFLLNETKKKLPKTDKIKKKIILKSLKQTAKFLKHTKAISKKSYVMNFIVEFYMDSSDFFISRKYYDTNEVLLELLKLYKKSI